MAAEEKKYPRQEQRVCVQKKHPYFKTGQKYFVHIWMNTHTKSILVHHIEATTIKKQNESLTFYADEKAFEEAWQEFKIDWDRKELIDNHGSGCSDWIVEGEGNDGKKYTGCGNYQSGELIDVVDIEED